MINIFLVNNNQARICSRPLCMNQLCSPLWLCVAHDLLATSSPLSFSWAWQAQGHCSSSSCTSPKTSSVPPSPAFLLHRSSAGTPLHPEPDSERSLSIIGYSLSSPLLGDPHSWTSHCLDTIIYMYNKHLISCYQNQLDFELDFSNGFSNLCQMLQIITIIIIIIELIQQPSLYYL